MADSSARGSSRGLITFALPIFLVAALLAGATTASAANFTVTTTADGSGSCDPGSCTLRAAVEAADAAGEPSTISVPAGEYVLTDAEEGSDLRVDGGVTISGAGADVVSIVQGAECDCRVFFVDGAPVTISGVTIADGFVLDNSRSENGGDVLNEPSGGGLLRLVGDVVAEGVAAGDGGGVYSEEGELEIVETTVSGNRAHDGGGLFVENDSSEPARFERDTFVGNEAEEEGGGVVFEIVEAFVVNSTFTANGSPTTLGGAINARDANVSLRNDTLAGDIPNEASGGAEIWGISGDEFDFVNTILGPASGGQTGSECFLDAEVRSENDIDAGESCEVDSTNGSRSNTDPQLEALAANGGPTKTMAIAATSPANEAANPADCPATDQRNVSRPQPSGTTCDIGAYEFGETGHEEPTGGGGSKSPPATTPKTPPKASCSSGVAEATSFKPKVRPGRVVPGVRVRLSAAQPSHLTVQATLIYSLGGKSKSARLGKLDVEVNRWRRMRFAIPTALRDELPLGTSVKVKLQITARAATCAASSSTKTLRVRVVKVFPHAVQFQRPRL